MPYPLPLTRTEAYLAYKAGVIQQSDLKPSLAVPRNGIDAWLAYWTGLAADYPKREDGTPHILQEEEAYIAYLCGVINEYPEKCLRRVGAYLRYIISARWGRPDHPLNREELYLSLIKTQFIPSGDPSSDITIDGTAKAPFVDVKMYGDTAQTTYTGKNFINSNIPPVTASSRTTISQVDNGIEVVRKNTSQTGAGYAIVPIQNIDRLLGQVVSYSFNVDGDRASEVMTLYGSINGNVTNTRIKAFSDTSGSFTMPASLPTGEDGYCLCFYVETGEDKKATFTNIQLELGSTVSSYEPYVGGTESPNPDYPQAINTVTGENVVKITGKNLFNLATPATNNGVTVTANADGSFTLNGTTTGVAVFDFILPVLKPAGTYTISCTSKNQVMPNSFYIRARNQNMSMLVPGGADGPSQIVGNGTNYAEKTFISTDPMYCLALNLTTTGVTYDNMVIYPQVEVGSTATDYEPYQGQSYEVNLGKNLLPIESSVSFNGITTTRNPDGTITMTGTTSTSWGWNWMTYQKHLSTPLPAGTYTFSVTEAVQNAPLFGITFWKQDKSANVYARIPSGSTSATIEVPFDAYYIGGAATGSSALGTKINQTIGVQLEAGSTATAYAPYFEPIELCKLGEYQDYIYKSGDDWKVHKTIGSMNLANGEYVTTTSSIRGLTNVPNIKYVSSNTEVGVAATNGYILRQGKGLGERYGYFAVDTDRVNFNTGGSSNPVGILYYALDTATDTTITDQTLIAQLEALVKGGSEEGTTYIKLSTPEPNLPGLLYVEAAKYVE